MSRPKLIYRPNNKGPLPEDLTGKRFGYKVVVGPVDRAPSIGRTRPRWLCRCDCGNEFTCISQAVKRGIKCEKCAYKGPRPYKRKRPYEAAYNALVGRGRHPVLITYEQFVGLSGIKECHYCGAEVQWSEYNLNHAGSGCNLDRKDSSGPYSLENVVVCCRRCNYGKNNFFSYEEWLQIGAVIRSWRKTSNNQTSL